VIALAASLLAGCAGGSPDAPKSQPGAPQRPVAEVRLQCADDVYTFGPGGLASNYELDGFDARAIAEQDAAFYGYDSEHTNACQEATLVAKHRYDVAAARGWSPYGRRQLWLFRWENYTLCALAVLGDYPGAAHRLIIGGTTARHAAQVISRESDRRELRRPAFDGCLPGLRLGLTIRVAT
jgi:hypothetical protein